MKRWQRKGMTGLLLGWWLGLAGTAWAGPYVNLMQPHKCPPNHYSEMHILTPALWRWAAWCRGPCRYTFSRVLHPDIATTTYVKRYHCPFVNPLQFSLQNYPGLRGVPPASSYQSQLQTAQAPQPRRLQGQGKARAPEVLPLPREEQEKK